MGTQIQQPITAEQSANVEAVKRDTPWLFAEHQQLVRAERRLVEAQKEYDAALERWNSLGHNNPAPPLDPATAALQEPPTP